MVLRADGQQIGVQIDSHDSDRFSQFKLGVKGQNAFDNHGPAREQLVRQRLEVDLWKIMVGIMPEGAPDDDKHKWVCVVAVRGKKPGQKVQFVATLHYFRDQEDDREGYNLPRAITFAEFQEHGELVGRFEGCNEFDIQWFLDYMQDNNGYLPATGVSFPSAEAHGPYGEKGGYDDEGKALKFRTQQQREEELD